jgi:hypothetical protein
MDAPVVIDVSLRKGSAKPAEERAATRVGGQRRTALAIDLAETIKLGVERVGQVMATRSGASDGDSRLSERSAVEANKTLPGDLAAKGAGVCQSEFREAKRAEEGGFLCWIGVSAGRETVIELCTY